MATHHQSVSHFVLNAALDIVQTWVWGACDAAIEEKRRSRSHVPKRLSVKPMVARAISRSRSSKTTHVNTRDGSDTNGSDTIPLCIGCCDDFLKRCTDNTSYTQPSRPITKRAITTIEFEHHYHSDGGGEREECACWVRVVDHE